MVNRRPLKKSFALQHGCTMVSREVQDLSTLWVIDYGKQQIDVVVSALNDGVVEHMSQEECNISKLREIPRNILYDAIWLRLKVFPITNVVTITRRTGSVPRALKFDQELE